MPLHLPSSTKSLRVGRLRRLPKTASQLGAQAPRLLEGSRAPDAAARQQGLHVRVAVPLRRVGPGAAEAVAMFLSPKTTFRDE